MMALMGSNVLQGSLVRIVFNVVFALFPSPLLVEGSVYWIIVGIGFYFLRKHKVLLALFYTAVSGFFFCTAVSSGFTPENLFVVNNQWLMIFSLIFILGYNGTLGRKMKYFFYIYYPLHVYVLVILARGIAGV